MPDRSPLVPKTDNKFYDVHCHAMNLSHPNLLAFLRRFPVSTLLWALPVASWVGPLVAPKLDVVKNLLTMMENDIGDFFLITEHYLKQAGVVPGSIKVGGKTYDRIVLTPLMMDFGYKNITTNTFYNVPAQKPIVEQVVDVFNGIAKYTRYDLDVQLTPAGETVCGYVSSSKERKLFEIYPFLGLNTRNYSLRELEKNILEKYFAQYDSTRARDDLYGKLGTFKGDIETMIGPGWFAGIKVYPPLGFDPWPPEGEERKKVELLYKWCSEKRIPITSHCSDGGFVSADDPGALTDPAKWAKVLETYDTLTLNLAHMGQQGKALHVFPRYAWRDTVLDLVVRYPNVYTDFSCRGFSNGFYEELRTLLDDHPDSGALASRVLFGSDFMINLLWADSYNEYLGTFANTPWLSATHKESFCSLNPQGFLFR